MKLNQRKIIANALPGQQAGFSILQWLIILATAGFFLLFAFRVVPLYAENRYVIAGLKSLQDSGSRLVDMTDSEIKKKMANFYMLNNVRSEGPNKNVKVSRSSDKVIVMVDYETRVNLFYNIDLVLTFKNHLDSSKVNLCCTPLSGSNTSE